MKHPRKANIKKKKKKKKIRVQKNSESRSAHTDNHKGDRFFEFRKGNFPIKKVEVLKNSNQSK